MNFGDFLDSSHQGGGGGCGGLRSVGDIAYSNSLVSQSLDNKPIMQFNTPGLSLALRTSLEGQGEMGRMGGNYGSNHNSTSTTVSLVRSRDDEHESRSGSDHMEGASGDELDATDGRPPKKKRYHRHTPQQIQELESLFKKCPHPDDKQRLELSRRLCLDPRQVKFWFQNRRTQMKTQLERHENSILRQENEKLRVENMSIREAMRNPMCTNCGGPAMIGDISFEGQHLRIENARLKDELERVCALAGKFLGRPISSLTSSMGPPMPNSCLELGVGSNGFSAFSNLPTSLPLGLHDFNIGISSAMPVMSQNRVTSEPSGIERTMYLELALAAMGELFRMAQTDDPLWIRNSEGGRQILNYDEYMRTFSPCIGMKPNGFVSEASRDTGSVIINSLALVETLMDSNKWADMFPCMISRSSMTDVISSGMGGTRNGALHLMRAELQTLTPLVPVREANFLRFCKQHAEGVWAVVDVTIDTIREPSTSGASTYISCRRLPSGCVVQDMPNGYAKVTWVEHAEYDESLVHQLYRPLISAGMGFGAQRWVATLQRQCECLALLMSSTLPSGDQADAITPAGRRSMLKLARRMTDNFCAGVSASKVYKWNKLDAGNVDENVRVMTRESDPGEPSGIVLSAATSVWLPISPRRLFNFLRDEGLRSEWDILSNGGPMQEMARIAKGQDQGNSVSLLRATAMNSNQSSMLILQETSSDASGSVVVYAPVDIPAMHVVMNGGDSDYVALLPSGFAIVPDGPGPGPGGPVSNGDMISGGPRRGGGSLLTVGFQILVNSLPTGKLTVESVETLNNLISCTVQKIKAALNCET